MTAPPGALHAAIVLVAIGIYGAVAAGSVFRKLLAVQIAFSGVQLAIVSLASSLHIWRPPDSAGLHVAALCVLVIAVVQALLGAALVVAGRSDASTSRAPPPPAEDIP